MLARIRDVLIITNPNENINFKKILGDGSNFGIKIQYLTQNKPNGLPEAFIIGEKFINKKNVALILGDNFFYGQGFTNRLKQITKIKSGSTIFTYQVNNPEDYGIVEMKKGKILNIKEKPKNELCLLYSCKETDFKFLKILYTFFAFFFRLIINFFNFFN